MAWAHAEDDFETIQYAYLAGNGLLGHYLGKDGIGADFLASFIGSEELYIKKFNTDISPEYIKVLEGYSAGLNSYAKHNTDEVLSLNEICSKNFTGQTILGVPLLSTEHAIEFILKMKKSY